MKHKDIYEKINALLENDKSGEILNALGLSLRENIKDTQSRLQDYRKLFIIVVLIFLLCYSKILTKLQIPFIELKDNSLNVILGLIPLVSSYLLYEITTLFVARQIQIKLHDKILHKTHSNLELSDISELFLPISTYTLNKILQINVSKRKFWRAFTNDFGGVIGCLTLMAPMLFCIITSVLSFSSIEVSEKINGIYLDIFSIFNVFIISTFVINSILMIFKFILLSKKTIDK